MAKNTNLNYKAEFCRQYFYQLKGFIEKFDMNHNNLGMEFLMDVYKNKSKGKTRCDWNNTINSQYNTINIKEEDLINAIEEYYAITNSKEQLQKQREKLFKGLLCPNQFATDDTLIRNVFVDEDTLKAILVYMGIKEARNVKKLEDQIILYDSFASAANGSSHYSINFFSNALHLFQQHRNDNAHNITKQDVPQRKISFLFLAFTYIGLVFLMRQTWRLREAKLNKFIKPTSFTTPSQKLKISITTTDGTSDMIIGYKFIPDVNISSYKEQTISPTDHFEEEVFVRKYQRFKLQVTYGSSEQKKTVTFGEDEDPLMLVYYYWVPTLEIHLPSISQLKPGLSTTGNQVIDDSISRLFEDANKQQNMELKNAFIDTTNQFLNSLEPKLQEIRALNENQSSLSLQQIENQKQLTKEIAAVISEQRDRNEQYFKQVSSKGDSILHQIENVKEQIATESSTHEEQHKDMLLAWGEVTNLQKQLQEQVSKLYDVSYRKLNLQNSNSLRSDITKFAAKHLWAIGIAVLLVITYCVISMDSLNYYWISTLKWWPAVLISFACVLIAIVPIVYSYLTQDSNRAIIIRPLTLSVSTLFALLPLICIIGIYLTIPFKTIEDYISIYNFGASHKEGHNAKIAKLFEDYLAKNPYNDEVARIQLAKYYLDFSGEKEKAVEVTRPMRDDIKKYRKGSLYAAEALYSVGEFWRVNDIIMKIRHRNDNFKSITGGTWSTNASGIDATFHNNTYDTIPAIINRIQGLMYIYEQYYDQDIDKGIKLLKYAADVQNDHKSQYYLGHIYSHIILKTNNSPSNSLDTLFNLRNAIEYFHKACYTEPKASLELGRIYDDLNMNDSAGYYLNKAILGLDDSLKLEAKFRLGLLEEKAGILNSSILAELKESNYAPALLHAAIKEKNHTGAIEYYETMGKYTGPRYIPPVVFEYIAKGDMNKALNTLKTARANGNFNEEFVKAVKAMVISNDSLSGNELMQKSANKGCKYAKMIVQFRNIEKSIKNKKFNLSQLEEMKDLSNEIIFANYLIANLLLQEGRSNEKLVKGNVHSNQYAQDVYRLAEQYGIKTICKRHPVGVLALTDGRSLGNHFENLTKNALFISDAEKERSYQYMLLRMAPQKQFSIMSAYYYDTIIYKTLNEYNKIIDSNNFFANVAIANNYLLFINSLLINLDYVDSQCIKRLLSAALDMVTINSDLEVIQFLPSRINGLRLNRSEEFGSFIDSLERKYANDSFKRSLIVSQDKKHKKGDPVTTSFHWSMPHYNVDNQTILYEFANIEEHVYDKPL